MTRKHFEALAASIASSRPVINCKRGEVGWVLETGRRQQWEHMAGEIATVCEQFNQNFDRARFLEACGVEEGK